MKRLIAIAVLVSAPAYGFEPEPDVYEPLQVRTCDPLTSLSIINASDCLIVGGSVHQILLHTSQDGWMPLSQNFLHFSGVSQTDQGATEAHVRFKNEVQYDWDPITIQWGPVDTLEIDRAYAAIDLGNLNLAAGKREQGRKGSVADLSGAHLGWPFRSFGALSLLDWHVGGAVVQSSYSVSPHTTFALAAEQLDTTGTLLASASYDDGDLRTHLTIASTDVLTGAGELGAHGGVEFDGGPFRAGATAEFLGDTSRVLATAEVDVLDLTFRVLGEVAETSWQHVTNWGVGVGYQLTDTVRVDLTTQTIRERYTGWMPTTYDTSMIEARLGLDLAEHLEGYAIVGQYHSGLFMPHTDVAFWGAGLKYEIKGRLLLAAEYEANGLGAYKVRGDAKLEF